MPIPQNIQSAISTFFTGQTNIATHSNINQAGNVYELYVYTLVHDALSKNYALTPVSLSGNQFRFKCSPGPINNSYSYFELSTSHGTYHLRNGIEVQGNQMYHEVDICVFKANSRMINGYRPAITELSLGLECKFYQSSSALKGEVRKYLGAMLDLASVFIRFANSHLVGCICLKAIFYKGFVTNQSGRPDLLQYLNAYNLFPKFDINPNTTAENDLKNQIQKYSSMW